MVLTGIPKSSLSKVQYIALTVETMAFSLPSVFLYKEVVSIPYSALMADSMPLRVIEANVQKKESTDRFLSTKEFSRAYI